MDTHMDWLLSLAASLRSKFYDDSIETTIQKYLYQCISDDSSIKLVRDNSILNQSASMFIIADDPKQVFHVIVDQLKANLSESESVKFRPLTIITKLAEREYILDVNGNQIIYGITSKHADNELVKSIICRGMYSIKNYFNQLNTETNMITPESLEQINPEIDLLTYEAVNGGRSKQKKSPKMSHKPMPRVNIKIKILTQLVEYVKTNPMFMGSLIYLNTLDTVDNHAMDIIYSDQRAKDAVIDYIKLVVQQLYADYRFEINGHHGYFVPFDFRLRKVSCMMKHRKTGQTSYLVNLYNAATYDPIPSYRVIDGSKKTKTCQLVAHPLVQMRFLYLDKFFLHSKADSAKSTDQFDSRLQAMLDESFTDLKKLKGVPPIWVGMYRDESYDRNQENMRSNVSMPYEVILI
jgi:hypothetical protein